VRMRTPSLDRLAAIGRWVLLLLLAGHLLLRREFAHRSVGELVGAPGGWLGRAYITEVLLLLLLPVAVALAWRQATLRPAPARMAMQRAGLGASFYLALAFLAWG